MSEQDLLTRWHRRLRFLKDIHFQAADRFRRSHHLTGIPLVILAALANAGIWAVLNDMSVLAENTLKLLLAILGAIITVLSAVQAFLSFDKRSEMHKQAAMKYSALSGDVDLLLNQSDEYTTDDLARIKDKWGMITENAPLLPRKDANDREQSPPVRC